MLWLVVPCYGWLCRGMAGCAVLWLAVPCYGWQCRIVANFNTIALGHERDLLELLLIISVTGSGFTTIDQHSHRVRVHYY